MALPFSRMFLIASLGILMGAKFADSQSPAGQGLTEYGYQIMGAANCHTPQSTASVTETYAAISCQLDSQAHIRSRMGEYRYCMSGTKP